MNASMQIEPVPPSERQRVVTLPPFATWLVQSVLRGRWATKNLGAPQQKRLKVLETLTIGTKKQLVLVSCGTECFLVGTGPESVQTIVRVSPETVCSAAPLEGKAGEQR